MPPMVQPLPHRPPAQVRLPPQAVPSATAGCLQAPAPSHSSAVQRLPSSAQAAPEATLDQAVALWAGAHLSQGLAGLRAPSA
ncbi:MAG: hypothetical protein QM765_08980 [Myxococcales bacterium]